MVGTAGDEARLLFIRRWGEMGATWGIGRTMAEIHAMLYLSQEPLCTDDIMEGLAISRGSASMNLRELQTWGLVQRVHQRGDRKLYYVAIQDVWQMFETIIRERRRREVQPILETIERCLTMIDQIGPPEREADRVAAETQRTRFTNILDFFETMNSMVNLALDGTPGGLKTLAETVRSLGR